MKWGNRIEKWRYENTEKKFRVEVTKAYYESDNKDFEKKIYWTKYLYLYPGHKDFGKYRPKKGETYPDTPWDWNYGITYYHESFDKKRTMLYQCFGDDYVHHWDIVDHAPLGETGERVFWDAERLINILEEEN